MKVRQHRLGVYCVCVCVCSARVCGLLLETGGVDAGDRVEFGDAALVGGIKALRLSAHLEEHFLLLQLPGKLFLQGLQGTREHVSFTSSLIKLSVNLYLGGGDKLSLRYW